ALLSVLDSAAMYLAVSPEAAPTVAARLCLRSGFQCFGDIARALGVSVPDDLSVVGCDDIFGASFSHPPLTTVTSPGESAGRAAVDMLIGRFATRDRSDRIDHISAHLTVRASTGPRKND
ncbi:MAG: substrate-binding domain-containing protein, partial [Microbacterium sp.]|uniref:substrate-binding domain-containing protein n=1 Tax=Microbacterium sp. TaxID=51671 RepID=UPI002819BB38